MSMYDIKSAVAGILLFTDADIQFEKDGVFYKAIVVSQDESEKFLGWLMKDDMDWLVRNEYLNADVMRD